MKNTENLKPFQIAKSIVVLATVAAIIVGCGSNSSEGAETAKPNSTPSTSAAPAPAPTTPAPSAPMGGAPAPQENAGGTAIKANELGPQ